MVPGLIIATMLFSCKKNNSTPPPTPVSADTLGPGWSKVKLVEEVYADIFFQNSNTGYILGSGNMYKTIEGGNIWNKLPAPPQNGANIFVTPDGKLFVVNLTDSIYRSTNTGTSFSGFKTNNGSFSDLFFTDNNNGIAVSSNSLSYTLDGGATWLNVPTPSGYPSAPSLNTTCFFVNISTGWVAVRGEIYRPNGSLSNWTKSTFINNAPLSTGGDAMSLFATSASVVYAGCDNGRVYKSVDGGINFTQMVQFPASMNQYMDIHFIGATGYACFGKRIHRTTDSGTTWQMVVSMGSSDIIELHFVDANHGWACTTKGEILKYN